MKLRTVGPHKSCILWAFHHKSCIVRKVLNYANPITITIPSQYDTNMFVKGFILFTSLAFCCNKYLRRHSLLVLSNIIRLFAIHTWTPALPLLGNALVFADTTCAGVTISLSMKCDVHILCMLLSFKTYNYIYMQTLHVFGYIDFTVLLKYYSIETN